MVICIPSHQSESPDSGAASDSVSLISVLQFGHVIVGSVIDRFTAVSYLIPLRHCGSVKYLLNVCFAIFFLEDDVPARHL